MRVRSARPGALMQRSYEEPPQRLNTTWSEYRHTARSVAEVEKSAIPVDCDLVYRWVNPHAISAAQAKEIDDIARYRYNDELRFSMRSFSNVLGVRNIHVVAKGRNPHWLDVSHSRIFWWNETRILDQLRQELGFQSPLCVYNSEPAKLAIARIPNLASRFLLLDDDQFMVPPAAGANWPSTRIFFDKHGIPLQTADIFHSHMPHPMLRDSYIAAANSEGRRTLSRLLASGSKRGRLSHRINADRLVEWTYQMWRNGTAIPVTFDNVNPLSFKNGADVVQQDNVNESLRLGRFIFSKNLWDTFLEGSAVPVPMQENITVAGIFLGRLFADMFFNSVRRLRPHHICVNDDWPLGRHEYTYVIQPFYKWLHESYPTAAPWELDEQLLGMQSVANIWDATNASNNSGPAQSPAPPIRPPPSGTRHHVYNYNSTGAVDVKCLVSGQPVTLPTRALEIPSILQPLLSQLTVTARREISLNRLQMTPGNLTDSISHLSIVDIDNQISSTPRPTKRPITVAMLNGGRGKHWCALAYMILRSSTLREVDVWLLSDFDLGMARSEQQHTARLLAYALGLNYAWAADFVQLTAGTREEQREFRGKDNRFGLHGNAILSRWPLRRSSVSRMMDKTMGFFYTESFEKRLGSRMTLFAVTGPAAAEFVVGSTRAQTAWHYRSKHIADATQSTQASISRYGSLDKNIILGGAIWWHTCKRLYMNSIVDKAHSLTHESFCLCSQGFESVGKPFGVPLRAPVAHSLANFFLPTPDPIVVAKMRMLNGRDTQYRAQD